MRWLFIAVATTALLPQLASAQFPFGPPPPPFAAPGGLGLSYHTRRLNVVATLGQPFAYQYGLIGPPVIGSYGFGPPGPWCPPPWFGFGPPPFITTVAVSPPRVVLPPLPAILPAKAEEPAGPPRAVDPNRFIVVRPDKANDVARLNPGAPPARVEQKMKPVDLGIAPAELPLAAAPARPRIEADRQLDSGKQSFARGDYGVALEHFRRATILAPEDSTAWFLLAQTQFAVGKFDEAATSIVAGLRHRPDWPASRFQSRDIYRFNPGAFDLHLHNLREAVAANPVDPRLLFLLGVELWFDDQRDEARPLLEKVVQLAKDPAPAEAFLRK